MFELVLVWKDLILSWCRDHPTWLFLAIAVLPGFAFPVAPLLILAGAVWGGTPGACALALAAILLNILWTHYLASGPCRNFLIRILGSHWMRWRVLRLDHSWRVACILRITPGVPLFLQNYLIGILGVPLSTSIALAIPITGSYVCGFVITGGAIFQGQSGRLILGISLIVCVSLVINLVRKRFTNTTDATPPKNSSHS